MHYPTPTDANAAGQRSRRHIGLLLFDDVEELDAVGPWEVLAYWTLHHPEDGWSLSCLSADGGDITGAKGLVLGAHHSFEDAPALDVLIHPGGQGTRPLLRDPEHLDWVRAQREAVPLMASVCSGSLVYAAAGLLKGRTATTHWASLNMLSELDPTVMIDVAARFVDDGDLITSAAADLSCPARLAPEPEEAPVVAVTPRRGRRSLAEGQTAQVGHWPPTGPSAATTLRHVFPSSSER